MGSMDSSPRPGGGSGEGAGSGGPEGRGEVAGRGRRVREWLAVAGSSGTVRHRPMAIIRAAGTTRRPQARRRRGRLTVPACVSPPPPPPPRPAPPAASQLSMQRPSRIGTASPSLAIRRSGGSWACFALPAGERGEAISTRQTRVSFLYCQKDR